MNDTESFPTGFITSEVVESCRKYGTNIEHIHDYTTLKIILKTLFSVFNIVMAVLIVILILMGQQSTAKFIGIVAGINSAIELIQEIRSRFIVKKLSKMTQKTTRVLRDKKEQEMPINDLVIGDTIFIKSGDRVPVDGEVLSSIYAEFDESILTGESKNTEKKIGDMVKAGSFIAAGSCYYRMTKFTRDSYIQALTKQIAKQGITESPLQSQINQIIRALTYMTIFFIALLVAEGLVQENQKEEIKIGRAHV